MHTWTYDGEIWSTGRNTYEGIQWTMAVSIHGSMMVFLALATTASFTGMYRRGVFLTLISYSVYWGDLLGEIPFYTGALLADLAISLNSHHSPVEERTPPVTSRFRSVWPILLTIFALFIASYPPNSAEMAGWSTFMTWRVGIYIFHSHCILSCFNLSLNNRGTSMGVYIFRSVLHYLFNSILAPFASPVIVASPRFLRRDFVLTVPHTRIYDALASRVDDILAHPAIDAFDICIQHYCIRIMDTVSHMDGVTLAEQIRKHMSRVCGSSGGGGPWRVLGQRGHEIHYG